MGSHRQFRCRAAAATLRLALAAVPWADAVWGAEIPAADLVAALARMELDSGHAVEVRKLTLNVDLATVELGAGWLFPTTPLVDRVVEMIFVGAGTIRVEPPDAVEESQLELFTGQSRFERAFDAAAFVVANDAASDTMLRRATGTPPDPGTLERASTLWSRWKKSPERRSLGVDGTLLADGLGEKIYASSFVAWVHPGNELPFIFQIDPVAEEQVNLGRFQPLEATERERRKIARELRSQQSSGRGLGVELEDLGRWEQWLSAPMGTKGGKPWPRQTLFEPSRYVLDATISGTGDLSLSGRARLVVKALAAGHRIVVASLHPDLSVREVRDARGAPLAFHRAGAELAVVLSTAPAPGDDTAIEVVYGGRFLDKAGRSLYALRDTLGWHPRVGALDRATYDVTLAWPKRLEVVAAGRRADGGERPGGILWERRTLDRPSIGFSFEVGRFEVARRSVPRPEQPPIALEVYFDASSEDLPKSVQEEIVDAAADSLAYFGEIYSPFRDESLRLVTVPRWSSQGLPGFITLSSLVMSDVEGIWRLALGLEDRRTTVAHEIAHQWWGNRVGWRGYRDQWISEAMASYSALLWSRNRLPEDERPLLGPTFGWKSDLLATLEDGRRVESLGPVTLGIRLLGGKDPSAYDAIVYRKGAVVLDMLSRHWKEADFLSILKACVAAASDKVIATDDFISMIEKLTGLDLGGFSRRFIESTGLPEIQFNYSLGAQVDGKWPVRIVARQSAPRRYVYSIVRGAAGRLAVQREAKEQMRIDETSFVVPFAIPIDAPWPAEADRKAPKPKKGEPPPRPRMEGRLLVGGVESVVELRLDSRPLGVLLDPREEVFARFFNLDLAPKRAALRSALDAAARGEVETARTGFRATLTADVRTQNEYLRTPDPDELDRERRELDARAHLALARLAIDGGDAATARREVAASAASVAALDRAQRQNLEGELGVVESRIDLAEGAPPDGVLKRLRKLVLKRAKADDAEAWLLLAIAADAAGDSSTLKTALEEAERRGGSAGPLIAKR